MHDSPFAGWIESAENRAARLAVQDFLEGTVNQGRGFNPLFVHGPPGCGKSWLMHALARAAAQQQPDRVIVALAAGDLGQCWRNGPEGEPVPAREAARRADLLIVEDVQHLASSAVEDLVQVLDARLARRRPIACTASKGPGQLTTCPRRLTSRLAAGLVVGIDALAPASRLLFLGELARRRELTLDEEQLTCLAETVAGSVRQLEGALNRVQALARVQGAMPDLEGLQDLFREDAQSRRVTVERIAQRVGRHFHLDPRQLAARDRSRHVLLPRQVGMYLARELTGLSLQQIGAFFGGRDHTTVLHACRKVASALKTDARLSGLVRQLQTDLQ